MFENKTQSRENDHPDVALARARDNMFCVTGFFRETWVSGNAQIWGLGKATAKGTANQQPAS